MNEVALSGSIKGEAGPFQVFGEPLYVLVARSAQELRMKEGSAGTSHHEALRNGTRGDPNLLISHRWPRGLVSVLHGLGAELEVVK